MLDVERSGRAVQRSMIDGCNQKAELAELNHPDCAEQPYNLALAEGRDHLVGK